MVGDRRLTYGELDERANRLAHVLPARGVGPGDRVGLQLVNGSEYLEGMLAAFKIRAVPINVNYRYVEGELGAPVRRRRPRRARAARLVRRPRVAVVAADLPDLRTFLVVADGSDSSVLDGRDRLRHRARRGIGRARLRSALGRRPVLRLHRRHDRTAEGRPVAARGHLLRRHGRRRPVPDRATGSPNPTSWSNGCPRSAWWPCRSRRSCTPARTGWRSTNCSAAARSSSPKAAASTRRTIWELVGREKVNTVVIVGDAMARPLCDELVAHPDRYDTSSLFAIGSGGAILSPSTKDQIAELLPGRIVVDSFGSSETGTVGGQGAFDGKTGVRTEAPRRRAHGRARRRPPSRSPPGPARSAGWPDRPRPDRLPRRRGEVGGDVRRRSGDRRWVIPGDMATVEAGRDDRAARTRLGEHQHGRREGLPRGGRVGDQGPSRRPRRRRGRRAGRALGRTGGRDRPGT